MSSTLRPPYARLATSARRWAATAPRTLAASALTLSLLGLGGCGKSENDQLEGARVRLQKQDFDGARLDLKNLLQANPKNGEARLLMARTQAGLGDWNNAEAEYRRALELGVPQTTVMPALAQLLLSQGKLAAVIKEFALVSLSDRAAAADLKATVAQAYLQDGQLQPAESAVQDALRIVPDHGQALVVATRLKAAGGKLDEALADATKLAQRQPPLAAAVALQGDLLMSKGQRDEALKAWRRAIELQPDLVSVHSALMTQLMGARDLNAAQAQWQVMQKALPRHPQTVFFDAALAEQRGDHQRAREQTALLLRGSPDNARLLLLAGEAELGLSNLSQAEAHFTKAVQVAPKLGGARRMLAMAQLRGQQPAKALATLQPLLDQNPPDADAMTLAGQAQMLLGKNKEAQTLFNRAAELKPEDSKVRAVRALSQLGETNGKDSTALGELDKAAAADPGNRIDLALIATLLRRGDFSAAQSAIDRMGSKQPDSPLADHLRGRVADLQHDDATARRHYTAALAKDPNFVPALAGLTAHDLAERKVDDAVNRFEGLVKRQPTNTAGMLALAEVLVRAGKPQAAIEWLDKAVKAAPNQPVVRNAQIDLLLGQQLGPQALAAAQAAMVAIPDNADIRERQGRAELANGQAQAAVATFSKLTAQKPSVARLQLLLAEAQLANRNTEAAATAVRKATELEPNSPVVQQAVFRLAVRDQKLDAAAAAARRVQQLQPDAAAGYMMEADVALAQKRPADALPLLRKALTHNEASGEVAARLHAALLGSGKADEAQRFVTEWQGRHPDDPVFLLHLGDQALLAKDLAGAEAKFRAVLAKSPANVMALNNLAYVLASQGKAGGSEFARKALQLNPNAPALLDTLALALAAEGKLPEAIDTQTQALKGAPGNPQLRLQLARLQLKAGDKLAARGELRELAKLGDKFPRQAEVSELLKQAGG